MELLCEYDFGIEYKPGKQNAVADALSRKSIVAAITNIQVSFSDSIREKVRVDPFYSTILSLLTSSTRTDREERRTKDFIWKRGNCISTQGYAYLMTQE